MTTETITTNTAQKTAQKTAQRYLDTWNATDESQRRQLLEQHWAPEVSYVDPLAAVSGRDGVSAVIAGAHDQFPGAVFTLVGPVDAHHDQLRFQWGLGPADADPVVIGFDVVVLDEQGRIADVRGFLDVVPG
jgi:SnoaL-like protein